MDFNSATTAMDFSRDAFLLSWAWIALSIFAAFRDIFHSTHRHSGQIHLNEGFLHAAFPAAVTLDDGSLEGDALETGHVERDIPGGGGEVPVIVTAAIALAGLAALVAGCLS